MAHVKPKMTQPPLGTLEGMGEDAPQGPPKPTPARVAIAENLAKLMREYITPTGQEGINPRELEKLSLEIAGYRVPYKNVQRLLDPYNPNSPQLDTLDEVAGFFKIPTFHLLVRRKISSGPPPTGPMLKGSETRLTEASVTRQKKRKLSRG